MKNFFTPQKQQLKVCGAGLFVLGFVLSLPTFANDKASAKFRADKKTAQNIEEATINPQAIGLKMPKKAQIKQHAGNEKNIKTRNDVETTNTSSSAEKIHKRTKLRLIFKVDEVGLSLAQRKKIIKFVRAMRAREVKPKGYTFIVHAFSGPMGENTWLAQERLRAIRGVLREQGINLAQANVTAIYLHTKKVQYIQVLPQY